MSSAAHSGLALAQLAAGNLRFCNCHIESAALPRRLQMAALLPDCLADIVVLGELPVSVEMLFDCGLAELNVLRLPGAAIEPETEAVLKQRVAAVSAPLLLVLAADDAHDTAVDLDTQLAKLQTLFADEIETERLSVGSARWNRRTGKVDIVVGGSDGE
ncbi:MAG: hypothetical protein AAGI24_08850 [Pseudomonadota bacterium]